MTKIAAYTVFAICKIWKFQSQHRHPSIRQCSSSISIPVTFWTKIPPVAHSTINLVRTSSRLMFSECHRAQRFVAILACKTSFMKGCTSCLDLFVRINSLAASITFLPTAINWRHFWWLKTTWTIFEKINQVDLRYSWALNFEQIFF